MSTADVEGRDRPQHRYPAEEPHRPQDVSDPHTTKDETADGWRDKYLPDWGRIGTIAAALAAVAIIGYGVFLFGGTVWSALQNTYVQVGLLATAMFAIGLVFGASRERSAIAQTDTLSVMLPNTVLDVPGEYVELGEEPAFIPYKGRTGLLRSQQQLTVNEVAEEYPSLTSKDLDGDDGAVIMLWDTFASSAITDRGMSVVAIAGGFEPTPYTDGTTHKAEAPTLAQQERLEDATATMKEQDDTIAKLEREVSAWQNRAEDLAGKLGERHEDVRDEIVDIYKELQDAHAADDGRRSRRVRSDQQPTPQFPRNGGDE